MVFKPLLLTFFVKKRMAKKDALRVQAEIMFIELGMSAKAIAEQLGVQEKTVGKWRQANTWDKRREELLASPHKIKELLLKEFKSIAEGNEPSLNSDAISKISKAIDALDDKINPRIVISVIKLLDEWLADIEPELAGKCLEHHKKFILHIINLHG